MDADKVIIEPVLTEKTNEMREQGKYVFHVSKDANKIEIKEAVRQLFSVNPLSCKVMNVKRKPKRVRYQPGYTAEWKKAIIQIAPGEKIDIFEGV